MLFEAGSPNEDVAVSMLTANARAQMLYIEYLCLSNECDKLFAAVEVCDSLLDYIDFCTETRVLANDYDSDRDALYHLLGDLRTKSSQRFAHLLDDLRTRVDDEMFVTPTLADLRNPVLSYLKFKEEVNTLPVTKRAAQVSRLAMQFRTTLAALPNMSLDELLQAAVAELEEAWPRQFPAVLSEYGEHWHRAITYGERILLEQNGVFPYRQDHRHFVFQHQGIVVETPADTSGVQKWFNWLQRHASGGRVSVLDVERRRKVYLSPSLDKYLCIRDMYQNTCRKFARAIPITMNQYLIKTYEEPEFDKDGKYISKKIKKAPTLNPS